VDITQFGIFPIFLLYVVRPLQGNISKLVMQSGPFATCVALRLLIVGMFMWMMHISTRKSKTKLEPLDLSLLFQASFFGLYICYLGCFWSLQYLTISKYYFLFMLTPFFTALFSRVCKTEVLSYNKLVSLGIGVIGFIPILVVKDASESLFKSFYIFNLPEIVLMISIASYAYSLIVMRQLLVERRRSLWMINGITMTGAGVVTTITAFFHDGWYKGVYPVINLKLFVGYTLLIACISVFCFTLRSLLLKKYSPTLITFFSFMAPVIAAVYGYFILSESISWVFLPSLCIVSIGLYIFYQDELQMG
jgi:drug/metabolite transporter (DMT)-like permease